MKSFLKFSQAMGAAVGMSGLLLGCGEPIEEETVEVAEIDDESLSQSEELTQCIAKGRTQFDGSTCASTNCGPTAAAMMRYAMTCGSEDHSGGAMRTWLNQINGQSGCGGTDIGSLGLLMEKIHTKDGGPDYSANTSAYADLSETIFRERLDPVSGDGWVAIVIGGGSGYPAAPCGFTGVHAIYAHRYDAANQRYLVYDPECGDDHARWWSRASLESWSHNRVRAVIGKGKQAYLSNLNLNVVSNGWGPLERDKSNGEWGAGDGGPITLNGTVYAKGLGVHAPSDVRYALPQVSYGYRRFLATVGVDDEVTNTGSVEFKVYVDGVLSYSSGVMTPSSANKSVNVLIPLDANQLRLVVTDGGNGGYGDHADWANARIY